MRKLICSLIFILLFLSLQAQVVQRDSLSKWKDDPSWVLRFRATPGYQIVKSGVPLLLSSALALTIDDQIRATRDVHFPSFSNDFDSYLNYSLIPIMLGMKVAGVKGRSTWGEMLTADFISAAIMAGVTNGLKYSVKRERPDGSRRNSFPSGHTATAFMAATMIYKEYGELSPWIGIGAYTSSTLVAMGRMMNDRHWLSDVLAGAGIGIMSTELGYFLSDLIFKKKSIQEVWGASTDYKTIPSYIEYTVGYSCLFPRRFTLNEIGVRAYEGLSTSISGAYYLKSGWGISVQANILSANLTKEQGTVGSMSFCGGPGYMKVLLPRLFWESKLQLGYVDMIYQNEALHHGFAIQAGTSLLGQLTPTMGLRLFTDYMYTTLPFFDTGKKLNNLNMGLSVSALF